MMDHPGLTHIWNDTPEREGLSDFRRPAPIGLREALGRQYRDFMAQHSTTKGIPIINRDPQTYVEELEHVESTESATPLDYSLCIGSRKGR